MQSTLHERTDKPSIRRAILFMENEIWKDIKGFEGLYAVSNLGRVKSYAKWKGAFWKEEHIMSQKISRRGYCCVSLSKENKKRDAGVHRLVAENFIDNPLNKPQVNHKDTNKNNNNVSNLEWNTSHENLIHAYANGLKRQDGEYHATGRLTWKNVRDIRRRYMKGESATILGEEYGVDRGHIRNICYGKFWKDKNYIWDTTKRIKK